MNGTFNPLYSSNIIYRDDDDTRCLTSDLEAIESDITTLENGKANISHAHTNYAETNHVHSDYALTNHEHSNYASSSHAHSNYALASDVTELQELVGDTAVSTQISVAISDKADEDHTHNLASDVTGILPLLNGGLGATSFHNAPDYAIARKSGAGDYLYYTPTNNGAFYATAENGIPQFGTLPTTQGGTGCTFRNTDVTITHVNVSSNSYSTCIYYPYLRMCWLRSYIVLSESLSADTLLKVIEIDNTYRPSLVTALSACGTQSTVNAYVRKDANNESGPAFVRIISNKALSAGAEIYVSGWFISPYV